MSADNPDMAEIAKVVGMAWAVQCRNAARNLPHKPSREAAERNAETLDWALAQLEQPQPKARRRSVVEPPPDDIWPTGGAA